MSWFYRHVIRPALFTQDAEQIHERTLRALGWASRHPLVSDALGSFFGAPNLPQEIFGLTFPNPVGLAAGMDKQARAMPAWAALGFGFVELGAATWRAQPGNSPPRLFRAVADDAIVNRMGFNNPGAEALARTLEDWRARGCWPKHPVGMNLGKSKDTSLSDAAEDYANSFRVLWPHVDFFVVNVSSPNTPDLRRLQDKAALDGILTTLQETRKSCTNSVAKSGESTPTSAANRPILVKVAPDLSFEALDEILELIGPRQVAGLVATNTTIARPSSDDPDAMRVYGEQGGLSGRPLRARSTEVVRHLYRQTRGAVPIVGVGGIFDAGDAWEKITAGASLVQIYTGLVFEGPALAAAIVNGLREKLARAGLKELREAIGTQA